MRIIGGLLSSIGAIWAFIAMTVVWAPVIVHLWSPDAWIPGWFPASGLEMLPSWLHWVPFPIDASLIPLVIANVALATPGVLLLAAGEKLRSDT